MIPSDHFVMFYNEIFKFLERQGGGALERYYRRVADRQAFFTLDRFRRDGFKGMYDYWERIRIEENCKMRNQYDAVHYESFMERCPSLSKALESETGPCCRYCDHCPGWVNDVVGRAGFFGVYDMIGRRTAQCRYAVYRDRTLAEERYSRWAAESGAAMMRTNLPLGMVRGRLADAAKFESLNPHFAKAFDFLRSHNLAELPTGRHEIDGDDVYANVMDVRLKPWDARAKLEVHRQYIDIHVPVTGIETPGYAFDEENVRQHAASFNVKDDYVLFKNPAMRQLRVVPGEFVAFLPPYGAHAPGQTDGTPTAIRKVVVKVRTIARLPIDGKNRCAN